MALIGEIAVNIVARTGQFTKGLNAVRKNLNTVGNALGKFGGVVAGGLLAAAKSFSSFGDDIAKMSKRTGIAVETLSALDFAAAQSGASVEQLDKAFAAMARFTLDAEQGLGTATRLLDQLGISSSELLSVSPEKKFMLLTQSIAQIQDPTIKAGIALEVFGRQGRELLPLLNEGKTGIAALVAEAHELGIVLSAQDAAAAEQLNDAFGRLGFQFKAIVKEFAVAVSGPLLQFLDRAKEIGKSTIDWIRQNQALVRSVGTLGVALGVMSIAALATAKILGGLTLALRAFSSALLFLTRHPLVLLATLLGAAAIAILEIVGALDWLQRKLGTVADKMAGGQSPVAKIGADAQKAAVEVGKLTEAVNGLATAKLSKKSAGRSLHDLQGSREWLRQLIESREGTANLPGQIASQQFLAGTQEMRNRLAVLDKEIAILEVERQKQADAFNRRPGNQFTQAARRGIHSVVESLFGGRAGGAGAGGGFFQQPIFGKIAKVIESIGKIPTELEEVVRSQNSIIQRGSQEAIAFARQHERRGTENDPGKQTAKNTKEMVKGINGVKEAVNEVAKAIGREPVFSIPAS